MKKVQEGMKRSRGFADDVVAEMKKCSWPSRQELMSSTAVVIVSVLIMSLFVGLSDKILMSVLKLLVPAGR